MGSRSNRLAAVLAQTNQNWYPADAQYAWDPNLDQDTTAVDAIIGGQLAKTGTAAVYGSGFWNMAGGANYTSSTGLIATASLDNPIGVAIVIDKNTHVGSTNSLDILGSIGVDSIVFGTTSTTQPRFVVSVNSVVTQMVCQTTWSTAGTAVVMWVFLNRSDPTNTILSGFNSTTTTSSGVLALSSGRTLSRLVTKGNATSSCKEGKWLVLSRAGLTFTQWQGYVARIKSSSGI